MLVLLLPDLAPSTRPAGDHHSDAASLKFVVCGGARGGPGSGAAAAGLGQQLVAVQPAVQLAGQEATVCQAAAVSPAAAVHQEAVQEAAVHYDDLVRQEGAECQHGAVQETAAQEAREVVVGWQVVAWLNTLPAKLTAALVVQRPGEIAQRLVRACLHVCLHAWLQQRFGR